MNQHDLFWLARYAYNTMTPAIAELREVEPSADLTVEMMFDSPRYDKTSHISISVHWDLKGMALLDSCLTTPEEVDRSAEDLRDVATKLMAGICPGCDRIKDDEDYGRDEDCGQCFIDGAPETQEEVTSPAYYNTDCWCEERPVRDCPVHGPCFCGSPKCEACAP